MKNKPRSFSARVREELAGNPLPLDRNRAYVRKCFLSGGRVSDPRRSYHLEFGLPPTEADKLIRILRGFGLNPKKTIRRAQTRFTNPEEIPSLVYIKEAGEIADALNIMTAHKTLLLFENIRVEKDLRNNLNRKVNFETANLNKTINAAQNQIDAIHYIAARVGLGYLSASLEEVAKLRLAYDTASLEEIGAMLAPAIGKSGVNHRLRKIQEIAKELQGGDKID
jgi:hypothetical protein